MKLNQGIKDERVTQLNNKIQSEAFNLMLILLGLSVFIKSYIFNRPVVDYRIELIILFVGILYTIIRGALAGTTISATKPETRKKLFITLVTFSSLITSISIGIKNYTLYGDKYSGIFDGAFLAVLGFSFISSLIFIGIILKMAFSIEQYGQKRLEKKLDNDEL